MTVALNPSCSHLAIDTLWGWYVVHLLWSTLDTRVVEDTVKYRMLSAMAVVPGNLMSRKPTDFPRGQRICDS